MNSVNLVESNTMVSDTESDSESNSDSDSETETFNENVLKALTSTEPTIEPVYHRIIGYAGVGKSSYILNTFSKENYIITAFTGIAAARLGSKTLSSMFKLGQDSANPIELCTKILYRCKEHHIIREMKGLIVDEFYTAPNEVMTKVNEILQIIRRNHLPFGGLDLVLVGDDRQTKCVDSNAFVDSELYQSLKFVETILPKHDKMRLQPKYMAFCDRFRNPKLDSDKILLLLEDPRFAKSEVPGMFVYHENKHVDARNALEMDKFKGEVLGEIDGIQYKKNCPIIILNNSKYGANGMIAKLNNITKKITKKYIELEFESETVHAPLNSVKFAPAFSITIHKAQCQTFKGINLYISRRRIERNRSESIRLIYTSLTRVSRFTKCFIGFL